VKWRLKRIGVVAATLATLATVACTGCVDRNTYCGKGISDVKTDVLAIRPATGVVAWQVTTEALAGDGTYDPASETIAFHPLKSGADYVVTVAVADGSRTKGSPVAGYEISTTSITLPESPGGRVQRRPNPDGGYDLVGYGPTGDEIWSSHLPRTGGASDPIQVEPDLLIATSNDAFPNCA
jgi:outer membrane protein assembly factor BamB